MVAQSRGVVRLQDSRTWLEALAVVDFSGVPGALGFYVAEAVDETKIELHHREGRQAPLAVDTHVFGLRYRAACETSTDPRRTGFIFDILRSMLPPLCDACGYEVAAGILCVECRTKQIEDLLRMTDPAATAR